MGRLFSFAAAVKPAPNAGPIVDWSSGLTGYGKCIESNMKVAPGSIDSFQSTGNADIFLGWVVTMANYPLES